MLDRVVLPFLLITALAVQEPMTVEGRITDSAGAPIADAEVIAIRTSFAAFSNAQGVFRLTLPVGTWSLRVRRPGYESRVIQIRVVEPITLRPIVLRAASQQLPEIAVEAKLPEPSFMLRISMRVQARMARKLIYSTWETRGAALSPNALAAVNLIRPAGPLFWTYAWHQPFSDILEQVTPLNPGQFTSVSGGCPKWEDIPIAARWLGLSDSLEMVMPHGLVWRQWRGHDAPPGRCLRWHPILPGDSILNLAPMYGGWLVLHRDSAGRVAMSMVQEGRAVWRKDPPAVVDSPQRQREAHLATSPYGATIATHRWPFRWIDLNASGEPRVASQPFAEADSARYAGWTALAVLPITNGFVQSILSPGARERRIVVYNLLGKPLRVIELAGTPALIASDLSRRRLLGIMFCSAGKGRGEIVEFEY